MATHKGTRVNGEIDLSAATLAALRGVPAEYDYYAITYVAAGNGAGEIETITYKNGGSAGTTIATLTLAYNADNKISSVTRT
jgi:hypothetical protein